MAGAGRPVACVNGALCPRRPRSSGPARRSVLVGPRRHKPASSCARRSSTSAKASTAPARRSRRLRLDCRRLARPASICRRPKRARPPRGRVAPPSRRCARGRADGSARPPPGHVPRCGRSSTRDMRRRRKSSSRGRHEAARGNGPQRHEAHRHVAARRPRGRDFVMPRRNARPRHASAGNRPELSALSGPPAGRGALSGSPQSRSGSSIAYGWAVHFTSYYQ
jgi:hypothetical protein